jgi:NAD(P)H-flavin reductase
LEVWERDRSIDVLVTVDTPAAGWPGPVGVVTNLLRRIKVNAQRTIVMVCGPKMLNRVAAGSFLQLHVPPDRVFISIERNMNCGFGRCGHCQYGSKFVCTDGPVFRFSDIADIFGKEGI